LNVSIKQVKSKKINDTIAKVNTIQSYLLSDLQRFVSSSWKHPLERRRIASKLQVNSAKILEELSVYSFFSGKLVIVIRDVDNYRSQNEEFSRFLKDVSMESFIELDSINIDSIMNIIEHSREEESSYSASAATILSAVGGAVVGSILTIVFSYVLGFL
jgi:hypothetical protein